MHLSSRVAICIVTFVFLIVASVGVRQFATAGEEDQAPARDDLPMGYVNEAPLPEGFPAPSEPGKVVEKEYPDARSYSATGDAAFGKLFGYLVLRQHKMTAPVIMTYRPKKEQEKPVTEPAAEPAGELLEKKDMELPVDIERMHFVLEKPALDSPKNLGLVKVADLPALRVLSIASQGDMQPAALQEAEKKLQAALESRADLESAGPPRLLGYNGPDVPAKKRYWELQIPVRAKESK